MTAVSDWDLTGPPASDADLARASAAGDKRAFADIYDRYADRLHDFCVGMLGDRDGAADCVQDAFCIAATQLPQLRDPDRLRPWLYSIVRNEALRRIRQRRRETPSDELPETASDEPGPDTLAARLELADLIADAAGGLSDRDRAVFELAFRHGLNGPDLAEALGVSPSNANTIVHRLRNTIERSLGALLVARRARNNGDCRELLAMLDGWDGHFNVLMRKRISRHIESCDICDEERRRLVSPVALLCAAPAFIPAPAWLRERTLSEIQLTSAATSAADDAAQADGSEAGGYVRGSLIPIIAFVVAMLAALASTVAFMNLQKTTIQVPVEVSEAAPPPTVAPPSVAPPALPPALSVEPAPPSAPAPRSASTPLPAATPTVVVSPPVSEPSDSEPSDAEPPAPEPSPPEPSPPALPPLPPPPLSDWPDWLPPLPPPPPPQPPQSPGGGFTGPGGLAIPVPGGPAVP
jgi:RNA polymerase sigma factor (sigma-70 family)